MCVCVCVSVYTLYVFTWFTGLKAKEKPPIHIVGDVGGKIAIVVVGCKTYF